MDLSQPKFYCATFILFLFSLISLRQKNFPQKVLLCYFLYVSNLYTIFRSMNLSQAGSALAKAPRKYDAGEPSDTRWPL